MTTSNCSSDATTTKLPSMSLTIFMVCLGFTSLSGVLGNALVIACVITSKKLQTFTNCFVLNLSVVDFFVCALFGPVTIYFWASGCTVVLRHPTLCIAMGAMIVGLCSVSILSLACISFNRYLLIVHGIITYRKIFNRRYIPLLVASSWLWGNSVLIPPFLGWGGLGYNDGKGFCDFDTSLPSTFPYEVYVICFSIGIPLTVTCICYVRIFLIVRKSRIRISQHSSVVNRNEERKKKDLKMTKDLFIIFGMFCLCSTPYALAEFIDHTYELFPIEFHIFVSILIVSNSTWNPFIYAWRNTDFRNAMRRVLTLKIVYEQETSAVSVVSTM